MFKNYLAGLSYSSANCLDFRGFSLLRLGGTSNWMNQMKMKNEKPPNSSCGNCLIAEELRPSSQISHQSGCFAAVSPSEPLLDDKEGLEVCIGGVKWVSKVKCDQR